MLVEADQFSTMVLKSKLYESIKNQNWREVGDLLLQPEIQRIVQRNRDTMFMACYSGPVEIIRLIFEISPRQIIFKDKHGNTSLHNACANSNHGAAQVVQFLLEVAPQMAQIANYDGMLPLHKALSHRRASAIIKTLLAAHPQGLYETYGHLGTPAQLFFDEWLDELEDNINHLDKLRNSPFCSPDGNDLDIVTETLLVILEAAEEMENANSSHPRCYPSLPVHRALNLENMLIPPVFIQLLIQMFKEEAMKTDENGNYPLHVGVAQHDINSELIESLIEVNPEVTTYPNRQGRIPLVLAMENGQPTEVIERLLHVSLETAYQRHKLGI